MFRRGGYKAARGAHHADSILYAARTGSHPFPNGLQAHFICDLVGEHCLHRPPRWAYTAFDTVIAAFPDAYTLLPLVDPSNWARAYLSSQATPLLAEVFGVSPDALPDALATHAATHQRTCRNALAAHPRALVFDAADPSPVVAHLGAHFELPPPEVPPPLAPQEAPQTPLPSQRSTALDTAVRDELTAFATRSDPAPPLTDLETVGDLYAVWDGRGSVVDRTGQAFPIAVDPRARWPFFADTTQNPKLERTEAVLNEAHQLGHRAPLVVDMQDARPYGTADLGAPPAPTLVYCRRPGTCRLVLWPLPRYHTPGAPGFVSLETPDEVPWSQKADAAVWRGALAGLTQAKLMPDRAEPRLAYVLARELSEGGDAWPSLLGLSRHNLVHRTATSPDIDAKLVLGRGQSGLANHPRLAPYVDARRAPSFFHRYRYVLSLAGYDTGSNFLMAANTRSVVLKEEDGWELYYTPLFRPWEHYIPLEPGALDAEAKIDWARANPKQCQEISAAARASAARLAQRSTRRAMLAQILDVVRSGPLASPPDGG